MVISKDTSFVSNIHLDHFISDHRAILCDLSITKHTSDTKDITYRKLRRINIDAFKDDLCTSLAVYDLEQHDTESSVKLYNTILREVLDKHAPEQHRTIKIRNRPQGLSPDIICEKRIRRRLERIWRNTKSISDRKNFTVQKDKVKRMLEVSDTDYYSNLVIENSSNPKSLFKIMNKLLHKDHETPLPPHDSTQALADRFVRFFHSKIDKIRTELSNKHVSRVPDVPMYQTTLDVFTSVSHAKVGSMIKKAPAKSSELDPIPTWLLKQCGDVPLSLITHIINTSLRTATMPTEYKLAILAPLLKKHGLPLLENNFRPVSNLAFISKLIERCVSVQMIEHMTINNLHEALQSAYKEGHSTETALLKVHNDICWAIDNKQVTILVLLDLSAAFDTVDHDVLLERLSTRIGIRGSALQWFRSYLTGRTQRVRVKDSLSECCELSCGVPQGSVLGPLLFTVYILPLGDLLRSHGLGYKLYADDSQLYMVFRPLPSETCNALQLTTSCVVDIDEWMVANFLKFNGGKTDMTIIGTKQMLSKLPENLCLELCGTKVYPKSSVRNLGVVFDKNLNFEQQITNVCRASYYQLHNIRCARRYLTNEATATAIHAFVTSRLDYANSLLYGLPKCQLARLQRVQNTAARLLSGAKHKDHITPVLRDLHWLPITRRIEYKILTLTYKALAGTAPKYICDLLKLDRPSRLLRSSSDATRLVNPLTHLKCGGDRSFSKAAPMLWNKLPVSLRNAGSLDTFKAGLKTHLFKSEYMA